MTITNRDARGLIAPKYTKEDMQLITSWIKEGRDQYELLSTIIFTWKVSEMTARRWIKTCEGQIQ